MGVETRRMLLGLGELYFNNIRVGNLKGDVTFTYTKEVADGKPGDMLSVVKKAITAESAVLTASICDIKVSQLRNAMGIEEAVETSGELRKVEEITLGANAENKSLEESPIVSGTVVVTSLNYATTYVKETDYVYNATSGVIAKAGSTLASGDVVLVAYDYGKSTAKRLQIGGADGLDIQTLKFAHEDSDGKMLQLKLHRVTCTSELAIPFHETEYTVYDVSFSALGDATRAKGKQLWEVVYEE